MSKTELSRRHFLGAAVTGAAALTVPAARAASSSGELPASWDMETDVVVLGCGGAGMMAACQAYDAGAKVEIFDKGMSPFHTATNLCGGLFTAWGSRMQKADPEGQKDTWETFANDIIAYGEHMSLKEPVYAFAKHSGEAFDWLEDNGLKPHHLEKYAGHSQLRAHRQESFKGRDYIEVLVAALEKRGLKILRGGRNGCGRARRLLLRRQRLRLRSHFRLHGGQVRDGLQGSLIAPENLESRARRLRSASTRPADRPGREPERRRLPQPEIPGVAKPRSTRLRVGRGFVVFGAIGFAIMDI